MRILLLTFYYPPDLSAGSFRAAALVDALRREIGNGLHIDVFTSMPNRYHSLLCQADEIEESDRVSLRRIPLLSHNGGMLDQSKAFIGFARAVLGRTAGKKWDAIVATSSRLMTAALGAEVSRRNNIPLYLDIRDLFTDTMADLLAGKAMKLALPAFRMLERRTLETASRVNVVSEGFLPYISRVVPGHDYRTFTNGIDDDFLKLDFRSVHNYRPLIVYAGNMGDGQGLHRLIPKAAQKLGDQVRFRLIGDGGRRKLLESKIGESGLTNVEILDPVPRKRLYEHYREADYLLLHLNDHAAFHKVLPSKIFEYAATGKPILAGVTGYAREFLVREVKGAALFPPCDADGCVNAFRRLEKQEMIDRGGFKKKFDRKRIMKEMAGDIVNMVENNGTGAGWA